jgi:transposase
MSGSSRQKIKKILGIELDQEIFIIKKAVIGCSTKDVGIENSKSSRKLTEEGYSVSQLSEVQLEYSLLVFFAREMKAYSLDLRQKIIDAYAEGNVSQRQLAKQFRVALSFIEKLLKQYRETGNIAAKVRTVQTPTKLNSEQLSVLAQIVAEKNDATLAELRAELEQKTGVLVSCSTVDRMLKRLNLTVKKNITCNGKTQ